MDAADTNHLRLAGALLLVGGIAFNIGAFSPPWEQWSAPLPRALEVIGQRRVAWYWIHAWFVIGVLVTVMGFVALANALRARPDASLFATLVATTYVTGAVFWLINIAFPGSVQVWAASEVLRTGAVPLEYEPWRRWAGLLFLAYMVWPTSRLQVWDCSCCAPGSHPGGRECLARPRAGRRLPLVGARGRVGAESRHASVAPAQPGLHVLRRAVVASPHGAEAPTAEPGVRHNSTIGPSSKEPSMNSVKVTQNLGMLLLGIWLILSGLIPLLSLSFSGLGTLMAILAIAAGALILVGR